MQDTNQGEVGSFTPYVWPAIVAALLLGHAFLMLLAMAIANADPPELVEGSPYTGAPPATASSTP